MYDLYRFTDKQSAESFIRGDLSLSALGYFWPAFPASIHSNMDKNNKDTWDSFEGTAFAQPTDATPFSPVFQEILKSELHYMMNASQYVNLLCMVQHFYNPYTKEMEPHNSKMHNWGKYAIRVYDVGVFIERLQNYAMGQADDYFLAGPIEYLDRFSVMDINDCFNKLSSFSYQNEWRVAYLSDLNGKKEIAKKWKLQDGFYKQRLKISIGSLEDVADIFPSEIVFGNLESLYNGMRVVDHGVTPVPQPIEPSSAAFYDDGYFGWGDRHDFRKLIQSIDGGLVSGRFII